MIVFVVIVVTGAFSYWIATIAWQGDNRPPRDARHRRVSNSDPEELRTTAAESMTWTAVDDRQFRRHTDGMSPDPES